MRGGHDEPRAGKKKKKTKAASPLMLILLLVGGGGGLLACCGCGVGAFFLIGPGFGAPDVVGKWEVEESFGITTYEFNKDRTGRINIPFIVSRFRYDLRSSAIKITYTHLGNLNVLAENTSTLRVQRNGDRLRIEYIDGLEKGLVETWRKIH